MVEGTWYTGGGYEDRSWQVWGARALADYLLRRLVILRSRQRWSDNICVYQTGKGKRDITLMPQYDRFIGLMD